MANKYSISYYFQNGVRTCSKWLVLDCLTTTPALDVAIIQILLTDHSAHNCAIHKSFKHLNDACKPSLSTLSILTFVISPQLLIYLQQLGLR